MLQATEQAVHSSPPEILTVRQVAKRGLLPERTLLRLVAQNKIPIIKSGRTQYINFSALVAMLNSGTGAIWESDVAL